MHRDHLRCDFINFDALQDLKFNYNTNEKKNSSLKKKKAWVEEAINSI
jgi:hypothetical protein